MNGKRCFPHGKNKVYVTSRHLVMTVQEIGKFKSKAILVGCPVIRSSISIKWRWWRVRWYVIAVLVTDTPYNKRLMNI
jgi:hypothetical protein